jgi:hypothetical protein
MACRRKAKPASMCTCRRHYPGTASGRIASLISSRRISLPRKGCRVGLRIVLFEACSAFTRVAACTLALSPIRDTLIEGFSHFVTSMTAPIASGWSGCRMGLAPTGKRRLVTAHTRRRRLAPSRCSDWRSPIVAECVADDAWLQITLNGVGIRSLQPGGVLTA